AEALGPGARRVWTGLVPALRHATQRPDAAGRGGCADRRDRDLFRAHDRPDAAALYADLDDVQAQGGCGDLERDRPESSPGDDHCARDLERAPWRSRDLAYEPCELTGDFSIPQKRFDTLWN